MKKTGVIFLFAALLFAGCAANKELVKSAKNDRQNEIQPVIEEAKAAISEAKKAGAEKYAKELLESAESKLIVATEALKKSDNDIALSFAKRSLEEAKLARLKALAGAMLEKAEISLKAAAGAGAEKLAPELYAAAAKDLTAGQKKNIEKDYPGAYEAAKKAYEEAVEAGRLCQLAGKAEEAIKMAKADIEEAEKAGARTLAPELFKSAEENLKKAVTAVSEKDYIKAIDYAGKASDDAKAAKSACLASLASAAAKYTVIKGDNLWNISKDTRVFADPFLWPLIYKTNREKIKDPDLIFPEQIFELPVQADEQQKKEAVSDAKKYKVK